MIGKRDAIVWSWLRAHVDWPSYAATPFPPLPTIVCQSLPTRISVLFICSVYHTRGPWWARARWSDSPETDRSVGSICKHIPFSIGFQKHSNRTRSILLLQHKPLRTSAVYSWFLVAIEHSPAPCLEKKSTIVQNRFLSLAMPRRLSTYVQPQAHPVTRSLIQ